MVIRLNAGAVRELVSEKRYTVAEFSRNAGISYNTARRILEADRDVLMPNALKIADALGVSMEALQ